MCVCVEHKKEERGKEKKREKTEKVTAESAKTQVYVPRQFITLVAWSDGPMARQINTG